MAGTHERPVRGLVRRATKRADRTRLREGAGLLLTIIIIIGSAFSLVALHIGAYRVLSPFDEAAHIDYLIRVLDGDIVRRGQLMSQDAFRVASCRGSEYEDLRLPPCGLERYDPEQFPDRGFNYLHEHIPTFYFITAVPVRLLAVVGIEDVVEAGRWSSGLWFALGLAAFWAAGRRLELSRTPIAIAMVLLATTPNIVHASSTVNDDATAVLAGSAIVLAVLWWERRGRGLAVLALVAAVVISLKPTHVLAVGAGGLLLLGRAIAAREAVTSEETPRGTRSTRSALDNLWASLALIGGAVLLMAVWLPIHEALAVSDVDPQAERFRTDTIALGDVVAQVGALLTPVLGPPLGPFTDSVGIGQAMGLLHLLVVAATFGAAFHAPQIDGPRAVGLAGALTLLVGGTGLTLVNFYLRGNIFIPLLPSRYAFSVLPFLFLGVAAALSRLSVRWVVGAFAVVSLMVTLNALLTAG